MKAAMSGDISVFNDNLHGQITEEQRQALLDRYDPTTLIFIIALPFTLIVAFGIPALFSQTLLGLSTEQTRGNPTTALVACTGLPLLIIGLGIVHKIAGVFKRVYTVPRVNRILQRPIISAEGQIAWRGNKYVAQVDNKRMKSIYHNRPLPTPGVYQFQVLDGTRWVLSIRGEVGKQSESDQILLEALAHANRYPVGTVAVNREQHMTLRQRLRLIMSAFGQTAVMVYSVAILIFFAVLIFIATQSHQLTLFLEGEVKDLNSLSLSPTTMLLLGALAIFLIFVIARLLTRVFRNILFALFGSVRVEEGIVNRRIVSSFVHDRRGYVEHYYVLDDMHFFVSEKGYKALILNRHYRIYYLKLLQRKHQGVQSYYLLSIEPVPATETYFQTQR